jgi:hypothetical protein
MAKSKNRKNHKKKVAARKLRVVGEKNALQKQVEILKKTYIEEMEKKSKESEESAGEVPLTLG